MFWWGWGIILEKLPDIKFKDIGFTNLDIREAKKVIRLNDIKMVKYSIAYMLAKYRDVANIKKMMDKISYITIYSALDRTSKINSIEPKVCTLAKGIFEIISNK